MATILDAAEVVLYVADMDSYELIFMNAHGQRIWGAGGIGQKCYKVLQAGRDRPCDFCTNPRLRTHGGAGPPVVWEFQNTVDHHWYLCVDKAIPWHDGRLVRMEVAIDITERKQQEQFREQYVGVISHDLRTPLSTIANSAEILKRLLERTLVPGTARPLEAIQHSSRRISGMIEDLLETTRLESGQAQLRMAPVDLAQLAAGVAERLATAEIPVEVEAPGPVVALADAPRLERVLENLVGNALRHSHTAAPVRVGVSGDERNAIVTVTDAGTGIPPEVLGQLFQRFHRGRAPDARGLGLGLYISRLIVEQHGGRIRAESKPGAGSRFSFALPRGGPAAGPAPAPPPPLPAPEPAAPG